MAFPRTALLSLLTALLLITGGTAALADDATPSNGPGHRDPGPQPTPPRESSQARTGALAATPTANLGLTYRALSAPAASTTVAAAAASWPPAMQGTIQLGITPSLVYGTSQISVRTTGPAASAFIDFPRSIAGCAILTSSQSTYVSIATFDTSSTTIYLLARDNGSDAYVDAVVYVQVVC